MQHIIKSIIGFLSIAVINSTSQMIVTSQKLFQIANFLANDFILEGKKIRKTI